MVKETALWQVDTNNPDPEIIRRAADILMGGGLVAFPTETVYGLGANALDAKAVESIFAAKGRPRDNPLIIHVSDLNMVCRYAGSVSNKARVLMETFWPGPLTLVMPGSEKLPRVVSAGLDSLAFRMPEHPVALALIKEAGVPLVGPSANLSGRPSPTTAQHTYNDLKGRIDAVLDGGASGMGVESTVLDITSEIPIILRPGSITPENLGDVVGEVKLDSSLVDNNQTVGQPRSPGMKYRHYAPSAPLVLVEGADEKVVRELKKLAAEYVKQGKKVGILCRECNLGKYPGTLSVSAGLSEDYQSVAVALYDALRRFDGTDVDVILAEGVEPSGVGLAVANRLRRAASKVIMA